MLPLPSEIEVNILMYTDFHTALIFKNNFVLNKLFTYSDLKSSLAVASRTNNFSNIIYLWRIFKNRFDTNLLASILIGNAHCGNHLMTKQISNYFKEEYLKLPDFVWYAIFHSAYQGHDRILLDLMNTFPSIVNCNNRQNIRLAIAFAMKESSFSTGQKFKEIANILINTFNVSTNDNAPLHCLPYEPSALIDLYQV